MPPISECRHCQMYVCSPFLSCAIHPFGPPGESCPDFVALTSHQPAQGDWEATTVSFYSGQPMPGFGRVVTVEEQLGLLDWHPLFTGVCPRCGAGFNLSNPPPVHWDCASCSWVDDTV